jgi:hypothetical protein
LSSFENGRHAQDAEQWRNMPNGCFQGKPGDKPAAACRRGSSRRRIGLRQSAL